MAQAKNQKKMLGIGIAVLLVLIAAFAAIYFIWMPRGQAGSKTIEVQVVFSEEESKDYTIQTDAEYLRQALEEKDLVAGDESEFGLFIKTVDGVTVDDSKNEWWCVTKDGEMVQTGVDTTPIADGDHFELTLSTY